MRQLFILGDSIAAKKEYHKRPEYGWGEWIEQEFKHIIVYNLAQNGRSSKSFYNEKLHEFMEQRIKKNDLCLIQFGHNDQKIEDSSRYTTHDEYHFYLKKYIDMVRINHGIPILLSSITRRQFIDGKLNKHTLDKYPEYMKELAKKEKIVFIDMFQISQTYIQSIGEENSKTLFLHLKPFESTNYPNGIMDNTHFNERGAKTFAQLIANELRKEKII